VCINLTETPSCGDQPHRQLAKITMRLDLLDEATRRFVLSFLPPDHLGTQRRRRSKNAVSNGRRPTPSSISRRQQGASGSRDFHALADELIAKCSDSHSIGNIYGFLLRTYRAPEKAKIEFLKFLSGQWPSEWLEAAQRAIEEERRASLENGRKQRRRVTWLARHVTTTSPCRHSDAD
jgi:hypothetical protein